MTSPSPETRDALARARLLALDVDGTLTDGRVVYVGDEELAAFHVLDGQGLVWLRETGVEKFVASPDEERSLLRAISPHIRSA